MKKAKMFAGVVTTLSVALPSMAWAQFEGVAAGEVELAKALRSARHELIELADLEELDERRALEFVRRLRQALRSREATRLALEDAMARGG